MKYIYNKLVRDKIPQRINKVEGKKANYKILNEKQYMDELNKKVIEEAHEFIEENSVEELGDLMEVISTIMKIKNITTKDVRKAMEEKRDKKEEKELNKKWRKND